MVMVSYTSVPTALVATSSLKLNSLRTRQYPSSVLFSEPITHSWMETTSSRPNWRSLNCLARFTRSTPSWFAPLKQHNKNIYHAKVSPF